MDRYFYSVEESDGDKLVHFSGNVYFDGEGSVDEKKTIA